MIYALRDLRARLAQERRITHLARNDSLTGLPNRASFLELLSRQTCDASIHDRVALLAIALLVLVMTRVRGHYTDVAAELALTPDEDARALPARVHALILVSTVHRPTLRALAYARASRPSTLQAVVVDLAAERTEELLEEWGRLQVEVPVTVLASPYREMTAPLIRHLRALRRTSPRDLVVVYIPEYVVAPGWHALLHNRTAARIKQRLHREPGVMVASVPWQLQEAVEDRGHDDGPRRPGISRPEQGSAGQ